MSLVLMPLTISATSALIFEAIAACDSCGAAKAGPELPSRQA
jgi:hypothetical protein